MLQHARGFVHLRPILSALVMVACAALGSAQEPRSDKGEGKKEKPSISLRANPSIAFSPAKIFVVAELRGGAHDDRELYCASVEWDWGDGTTSQSSYECEPYELGKSEIRRRFANEHTFTTSGEYRVRLRLKQKNRTIISAQTTVRVRPGVRDIGS